MEISTVIKRAQDRGQGVIYKANLTLNDKSDVVFGFSLSQCVLSDIRSVKAGDPDFIEFIKQNTDKTIGILIDAADNKHSLNMLDEMLSGLSEINTNNVIVSVVIEVL